LIDNNSKVIILLATFNGAKYLKEQIESIINQTYTTWRLIIRDDGSTDSTISIIETYCQRDSRIEILKDDNKTTGACQNFAKLLEWAINEDFHFLMFSDQDDYWLETKIEDSLEMIIEKNTQIKPLLIYTDFQLADDKLEILSSETDKLISKWKTPVLNRILAQNSIYGCTMILNKELALKCNPIPVIAENHDYWISLVASCVGEIFHLEKRTILYRQHNNNVSGHYTNSSIKSRFARYFYNNAKNLNLLRQRINMAKELIIRYQFSISDYNVKMLRAYSNISDISKLSRIIICFKYGIRKDRFLQSIAFYYNLLKL
jgi:rhamnosyltransferase